MKNLVVGQEVYMFSEVYTCAGTVLKIYAGGYRGYGYGPVQPNESRRCIAF